MSLDGFIHATLVDGTQYRLPISVVIEDAIQEEMIQGDLTYDVATNNVIGALLKKNENVVEHANKIDILKYQSKLILVSENPTTIKMKFAWRNAKKEVVYE